jgi:hypothetical protein
MIPSILCVGPGGIFSSLSLVPIQQLPDLDPRQCMQQPFQVRTGLAADEADGVQQLACLRCQRKFCALPVVCQYLLPYVASKLHPNLVVGIEPYASFRAGLLVHVHCHVLS